MNKKIFLQSYKSISLSIQTVEELIQLLNFEQKRDLSILADTDYSEKYNSEINSLTLSLKDLLNEKNQICRTILLEINQMSSEIEKNILTLKYISGYTWEQISEITNYSLRQVYNIHNHALLHINT